MTNELSLNDCKAIHHFWSAERPLVCCTCWGRRHKIINFTTFTQGTKWCIPLKMFFNLFSWAYIRQIEHARVIMKTKGECIKIVNFITFSACLVMKIKEEWAISCYLQRVAYKFWNIHRVRECHSRHTLNNLSLRLFFWLIIFFKVLIWPSWNLSIQFFILQWKQNLFSLGTTGL